MKTKAGLWIDHRKAIIVTISNKNEALEVIESDVEKQLRRTGDSPLKGRHESFNVPADNSRYKAHAEHLSSYYKDIVECLRNAESILIFGPGEAKSELKGYLEQNKLDERIADIETADKMTDNQILAKVRHYFSK